MSDDWFTSSYSGSSSNCVETRISERTEVRDSQNPETATLAFPASEWTSVVAGLTLKNP
ncbi:DUF397 domain-containing protein [Nocardiopsis sp. NPDC055824]